MRDRTPNQEMFHGNRALQMANLKIQRGKQPMHPGVRQGLPLSLLAHAVSSKASCTTEGMLDMHQQPRIYTLISPHFTNKNTEGDDLGREWQVYRSCTRPC